MSDSYKVYASKDYVNNKIMGMQVATETLEAGSEATAQWDGEQGLLTLGIPMGPVGPQGVTGADGKDAVVDATLTQSGQSADAKVTGDAVSQLKGDLDKLDVLDLQLVRDTLGVSCVYDGNIIYDCPGGKWKFKDVNISDTLTGVVSIIIDELNVPSGGHLRVYNADKSKQFTPNITESGVRVIDLTGYTGLRLQLQASESTACEAGVYYAKGIKIYTGDITSHIQGLPDYFVGTEKLKSDFEEFKESVPIELAGVNLMKIADKTYEGRYIYYNSTYNYATLSKNDAYTTVILPTKAKKYRMTVSGSEKQARFICPLVDNKVSSDYKVNYASPPVENVSVIDNTIEKAPFYAVTIQTSIYNIANVEIREEGFSQEVHYCTGTWKFEKLINSPNLHCYLPREICVGVGRTIELYNNLVCLEADKYHMDWTCDVGTDYDRKWSVTGTDANIGDHTLTLKIYDDDLNVIKSMSTTVKVVANAISEPLKVLPIGDSLTNMKAWLTEVQNLSDSKIQYIGTRGTGSTYHHEGRSGATAKWYNANRTYTFDSNYVGNPSVDGASNPFWDGTKFSLAHYIETQSGYVDAPDAVQLLLGTNGIKLDPTENADNIKAIVDSIRSEYPTMNIFVCNTIYRSNQNGYYSTGADGYAVGQSDFQYSADMKIMNLQNRLVEVFAEYENVHIVPLSVCMDRDYNFGQKEVSVNPRSSVTIKIPNESVHPQNEGYMQMADVMYSSYIAYLT